jgi:hypothetical protein
MSRAARSSNLHCTGIAAAGRVGSIELFGGPWFTLQIGGLYVTPTYGG